MQNSRWFKDQEYVDLRPLIQQGKVIKTRCKDAKTGQVTTLKRRVVQVRCGCGEVVV